MEKGNDDGNDGGNDDVNGDDDDDDDVDDDDINNDTLEINWRLLFEKEEINPTWWIPRIEDEEEVTPILDLRTTPLKNEWNIIQYESNSK